MTRKFFKAGKMFNKFLKIILGSYMQNMFGFKIYNEPIKGLQPPYIILSNHTNFWDPFLLSMCIPYPVYFVASDAYFRNFILRWLLKLVGAIPKTKSVSDPLSIKRIIAVCKNDGIIGIFPEGKRNWDGTTLPLLFSTAKLIKYLNLPVINILSKGSHLSFPRWAKKTRKGELTIYCSKILDADSIGKLSVDKIYEVITEGLKHDEYEYQRANMFSYKAKHPAEKLELFLFCCPNCKTIGRMKSLNEYLYCESCNYTVEYDKYGFFKSYTGTLIYDNPKDWNMWQLNHLKTIIETYATTKNRKPILEDNNVVIKKGYKAKPLKKLNSGRLLMFFDKIEFHCKSGDILFFDTNGVYGQNVQSNDKLEFYYDNVLYRFYGKKAHRISAYKWVKGIDILKNLLINTLKNS